MSEFYRDLIARLGTVIIAALLVSAGPAYCQNIELPAKTFTIKDSVNTAIRNNRSIQIQEEELRYAKANILYAKALFLPTLTASFGYTLNDAVPTVPDSPTSRKDPQVFFGYKNNNVTALALEETIYNGGANIANLEQAKLNMKAQEETLRQTKLEIEFEAKRLFYGLLLAYETKRIAKELVDRAEAHYKEVSARFSQGTVSKFDVLQSKTQVAREMPQLVNAQNAIELLMVEFKKLLVLKLSENIIIMGELKPNEIEIKESDFLQEAYSKNPQMILKLLGIDINRWAIEYAKSGWLPQVTASAGGSYTSDNFSEMINSRQSMWNIGVKASIAIFDGFATKAKVDEAKAKYNQSTLQKDDIIDQIAVDIKNACLDLTKSKTIIDTQRAAIVEAAEALRLSEVRYNNGVGINLDIFDSQVALAQVEQSLAQGIYDYVMARSQLDLSMGREFFEKNYI